VSIYLLLLFANKISVCSVGNLLDYSYYDVRYGDSAALDDVDDDILEVHTVILYNYLFLNALLRSRSREEPHRILAKRYEALA
jgi:hypothetical protein